MKLTTLMIRCGLFLLAVTSCCLLWQQAAAKVRKQAGCVLRHGDTLHHVWSHRGHLFSNDTILKVYGNCNFSNYMVYHSRGFRDIPVSGSLLAVAKPFQWRVWYHLLFEDTLSVMKVLDEQGLLDSPQLAQEASVLYTSRLEDWVMDVRGYRQPLQDLWDLFLPRVFFDIPRLENWTRHLPDKPYGYWHKAVFVDEQPSYFGPGERWAPIVNKVRELVAAKMLQKHGDVVPAQKATSRRHVLQEQEGMPDASQPYVLFIYREWHRRFIKGDDEIEAALKGKGLKVIKSNFWGSLHLQWYYMHHAQLVVAAHGSALSNLLWMQPQAALIEIFPYKFTDALYKNWALMLKLRYFNIEGAPSQREHFGDWLCQDGTTEEECQPGLPAIDKLCCSVWWRDQNVLVDLSAVNNAVDKALDVAYRPTCVLGKNMSQWGQYFSCA